MPAPKPKPALTKAPRKTHPASPAPAAASAEPARAKPAGSDTVQINVRVPKEVRTRVKRSALDADQTVNEWLLDAVERKLGSD